MHDEYDYGYRTPDGREIWSREDPAEGVRIPAQPHLGVPEIRLKQGEEVSSIYLRLEEAALEAVAIRRATVPGSESEDIPNSASI